MSMPFGQAAASCSAKSGARIETGVETQLFHHIAAFFRTAGDADDAAAFQLPDLADHRTTAPLAAATTWGFTCLRLADVEQPYKR